MKKLLKFGIFNESNIWAKVYHFLKKWGIEVSYCCNCGPWKLLLHFFEYRLDQLNSKHTKKATNSARQYFKGCLLLKEMSTKSLKIFGPPITKWPCKIFGKLNENYFLTANIFKLHEYQTFGLIIWFSNKIFSLWKSLVYD